MGTRRSPQLSEVTGWKGALDYSTVLMITHDSAMSPMADPPRIPTTRAILIAAAPRDQADEDVAPSRRTSSN